MEVKMAKNTSIAETVRALAEPIAEGLGCWLWDVEFVKEGARRVLRITIDAEEGGKVIRLILSMYASNGRLIEVLS